MGDNKAMGTYYVHDLDPVFFNLFGIDIKWYGVAYLLGFMFGKRWVKRIVTLSDHRMSDDALETLVLYILVGMVLGARLAFILFYGELFNYLNNPIEILNLRGGGLSFHGGLLGGFISVVLFYKWNYETRGCTAKQKRENTFTLYNLMDGIACALPFGIMAGRVGNFINSELCGFPTNISWAVIFYDGVPRHPSQIYEALSEGLLIFLILNVIGLYTRILRDRPGCLSGLFLILYSIFRYINEFFREAALYSILDFRSIFNEIIAMITYGDDVINSGYKHIIMTQEGRLFLGQMTIGQLLSIPLFLIGAWTVFRVICRPERSVTSILTRQNHKND